MAVSSGPVVISHSLIGWRAMARHILTETSATQTSLSAAGCAFFATLSLFPGLTALISLYGLMFDPQTVEPQLDILRVLLPPSAYSLIVERIHTLVMQPRSSLTIGLVSSLIVVIWSASASSRSILSAIGVVYRTTETRSFLRFQVLALCTTLTAIIGACLTLALMVAAPAIVTFLPHYVSMIYRPPTWLSVFMAYGTPVMINWLGPGLMLLFIFMAVTLLYRYAPCRDWVRWRWVLPGALVATGLWVLMSSGFSWYVGKFAFYGAMYGPLGAVAAIMMWLFVSAYVVLFGAVVNVALEERARQRSQRRNVAI